MNLLDQLQLCADDPMWATHAEVPKVLLRAVITEQRHLRQAAWNARKKLGFDTDGALTADAVEDLAALIQQDAIVFRQDYESALVRITTLEAALIKLLAIYDSDVRSDYEGTSSLAKQLAEVDFARELVS